MTTTAALIIISTFGLLVVGFVLAKYRNRPKQSAWLFNDQDRFLLTAYVLFYRGLDSASQSRFEKRMLAFLTKTTITGVGITVERMDELFIAASAIIPVFGYANWQYMNLNEVLLYPAAFDRQFDTNGFEHDRAGVVGDGPLQNIMVLSQADVRSGFFNQASYSHTGVHEFVHLVDKTDGAIDGIPETLMDKMDIKPWQLLMRQNMELIRCQQSDIDAYAATSPVEFLAVTSEYFFKQPEVFRQNHPALYQIMTRMYKYNLYKTVPVAN